MNGLAMFFHAAGLGPPGWKHTQASSGLSRFASKTLRVPPKQYLRVVVAGEGQLDAERAQSQDRAVETYPTKARLLKPPCSFRSRQNCAVIERARKFQPRRNLSGGVELSYLLCDRLDMSHRVPSEEPWTDLECKGPCRSGQDAHPCQKRLGRHRFMKFFGTEL